MKKIFQYLKDLDWILLLAVFSVVSLGLITINSFSGDDPSFNRQLVLVLISFSFFLVFDFLDFRFLRRTGVVITIFFIICGALLVLLLLGTTSNGVQRWLNFGFFSLQVSEFAKLALIILLAKYFTKRHIDICQFRHIFISGAYASIFFLLVFLQPDFGSAIILAFIWLGMVMISGISFKHLGMVSLIGVIVFSGMWFFALQDYQKERVISFLQPYADVEGDGYHTRQSIIAIGSGELLGKGIGHGTQSQLRFLPEHKTDFIFAAFAEEWGFVGVVLLFYLYGLIIWRMLINSQKGETNFEALFGIGVVIMFVCHIVIHVGANVGVLPVTGTTLPFMSFGGSHIFVSFLALGIFMSMRRNRRVVSRERLAQEVTIV
jgi:rod shape determining protein RodA